MKYIKIGDLVLGNVVYQNRCLSENFPGGPEDLRVEVLPWEGTENKPYDYKYENDKFILDVIEIPLTPAEEVEQLKQNLEATDYQAIKFAEGWLTAEEYEPIKQQREAWRERIRELEPSLNY